MELHLVAQPVHQFTKLYYNKRLTNTIVILLILVSYLQNANITFMTYYTEMK